MPSAKSKADSTQHATAKFPTAQRGTEIQLSRGRAATPSIFIADAEWSLDQTQSGNMTTSWVTFQNVARSAVQELKNEWTKAARQCEAGLSTHIDEHANGTYDASFRVQEKRARASKN